MDWLRQQAANREMAVGKAMHRLREEAKSWREKFEWERRARLAAESELEMLKAEL